MVNTYQTTIDKTQRKPEVRELRQCQFLGLCLADWFRLRKPCLHVACYVLWKMDKVRAFPS